MEKVAIKDLILRTCLMTLAMTVFSFGMTLFLATQWGSSALPTLQQALFQKFGIDYGLSNVLFNGVILLIFLFWDRRYFHVGTLVVLLLPGYVMDFARYILGFLFEMNLSIPMCVLLLAIGSVLCAMGMSVYYPSGIGMGAQDMIILKLQAIFKISFKVAYYIMNGTILILGIALGGSWGVGTLVSLFVIGYLAEFFMKFTKVPVYRLTHQYARLSREFPEKAKELGLYQEEDIKLS